MNSFIKEQMILFDYRQKNNWLLGLDEEVESNHIKESPLPLDNILFNEKNFHSFLSKGCQLQSVKEDTLCLKMTNIPDKSTEDIKVINTEKKNILQEEKEPKRVIDSTESTERKDKIEIKKMIFSTKKPNENEETHPNSRKDDDDVKKSVSRKYFRVEDAKKHIKKAISQFATEELNRLIKNSELGAKFKKIIHVPNYKLFTSNSKELDNLDFLSFSLKKVFTYGKKDGNRQDKNEKNLSRILEYKKYPEKTKKIKEFLDLTYEQIIKLFYKSSNFEEFRNTKLTQFFDEGIKSQKKISLLEDEGLLKLFEMTKKKRKRNFVSVLK
jgi:hypothetical protein